ncbi:hypothetical protein FSARC_14535 [Fusarium sarcochroum]|uniref:WSC domain-containing protein n=1 Tax=Fusarium sarcochroum TaxID=1208366 RepID=A0A8H4SSG2_9HYPO|nr:hypothetical protein FSARC_14535 [Fusarium sarcochroum]
MIFAALFFWVALAVANPPFIKMLRHQGCYSRSSRTLGWSGMASNNAARHECARTCVRQSKAVVMFRNNYCYCADTYPMNSLRADDENCYMPCIAIDKSDCDHSPGNVGRKGYFNVYSTGMAKNVKVDADYDLHEPKPNAPSIQPPESAEPEPPAHACHSELPPDAKLRITWTINRPDNCYELCREWGNKFVMMRDNKCYCSNTYPRKESLLSNSKCEEQCPASPDSYHHHRCGGRGAYSVYNLEPNLGQVPFPKPNTLLERCFTKLPITATPMPISLDRLSMDNFHGTCLDQCKATGKDAAMMRGTKCYCTNALPRISYLRDNRFCQIPCAGSTRLTCGGQDGRTSTWSGYFTGYNRWSNYQQESNNRKQLDTPRTHQKPYSKPVLGKMTSNGCYDATSLTISHTNSWDKNTIENCANYCKREDRAVAATQGKRCLCSHTYPLKSAMVRDSRCRTPCPGYARDACGGRGTVWSVLNTGAAVNVAYDQPKTEVKPQLGITKPAQSQLTPRGCFRLTKSDSWHRMDVTGSRIRAQGDSCTFYCATEGYPIALRQDFGCFCAHEKPPESARKPDWQCWYDCHWDRREECGGPKTFTVYNTLARSGVAQDKSGKDDKPQTDDKPMADKTKPKQSKLTSYGCFDLPLAGTRHRINVRGSRSRAQGDSCNFHCAAEGYSVAMRHGSTCFCDHKLPSESERIDDKKCWHGCRLDHREMCGGPNAFSVYNLGREKTGHGKESAPGASPVTRPQCSHSGLERVKEASSWVASEAAELGHKAQKEFSGFVDKAQDVFDACLWKVMVTFSNVMVRLGWASNDGGQAGDIDL